MKKRINFSAWNSKDIDYPAYAMLDIDGWSDGVGAVASAIARKNGWQVVSVRHQYSSFVGSRITDDVYTATLGTPCDGGGYTPRAEVWFSIARETEEMAS